MPVSKERPETVTQYIARSPKWAQLILKALRKTIKVAAPKAKESISYRMPYYSQNGRLAYFAAHKKHVGFYWIGEKDKRTYAKELASYKVVGNSLHILEGKPMPVALIKKIVRSRVKNNEPKRSRGV